MKNKWVIILLVVLLSTLSCLLFACDDPVEIEEPKEVIKIEKEDIVISDFSKTKLFSINKIEGVAKYRVSITPSFNTENVLYEKFLDLNKITGEMASFIMPNYEEYQDITFIVEMFNENEEIIGEKFFYEFSYIIKDQDIVIDESEENGLVEGVDDKTYFYARYQTNILYTRSTKNDLAILFESPLNITSLEAIALTNEDWEYIPDKDIIVIKKSYLNNFSTGAKVGFTLRQQDSVTKFFVNITNGLPLQVANSQLNYIKFSGDRIATTIITTENKYTYVKAITIDGVSYPNSFGTKGNELIISNAVLNKLSYGEHIMRLYFEKDNVELGYTTISLLIQHKGNAPYNLKIDYDSKYPNVFVSWDSELLWDEAIVTIGATEYSSLNSQYSKLFSRSNFNAFLYLKNLNETVSVKLRKDNQEYVSQETVTLDQNLNDALARSHLNNKFDYIGKTYNTYISSKEELAQFVAYNIINYSDDDYFREVGTDIIETYTMYAPYLVKEANGDLTYIKDRIYDGYNYFVEPVRAIVLNSAEYPITLNGNEITYSVHQVSGGTRPYTRYEPYYGDISRSYIEYEDVYLSYYHNGESTRDANYEGFKVNEINETADVSTSVELYLALEAGLKPVCAPGSNAEKVYNTAKKVLREIVDDNMGDYKKLLAIYEWISYNTVYDRGLTSKINNTALISTQYASLFKNTSFFAEGVFYYGVAQCNGIAAAFSILCNIEGIKCIKTMGTVSSGNHAWNKVCVNGDWYVCDPTWANARDITDSSQYYEYITYDYLMMSAKEAASHSNRKEYSGYEAEKYFAGDGQLNYWASLLFVYEDKIYDHVIDDLDEFIMLIKYYTQSGANAIIAPGSTRQVSIKVSSFVVDKWLEYAIENNLYEHARYKVVAFARSNDGNGNSVSDFKDTTYLRITGL